MRLDSVNINNFCSCLSVSIALSDFNPIVGYNNSGKSNILRAINWLLKKSVLTKHHFHAPADPIMVEGVISGITAALPLLPTNQQAQVLPFIDNDKLIIRRRQDQPNCSAKDIKLDVFNPTTGSWASNPTGIDNAIGVLFPEPIYIEAMDDAADDVGKFGTRNTIGLLLKYTLEQIRTHNAAAVTTVQQALQNVGDLLNGPNRIDQLASLETQATTALGAFFPGLSVHLKIETPELDELVKGATLDLSDAAGTQRPFASYGHGAQRTVQMAMIQLLAQQASQGQPAAGTVILLIDEPELYLHPQAVEILKESLQVLSRANFQVIFSTHSPLFAAKEEALNTSVVYKTATGETAIRQKLASAATLFTAHPHQASVIFSLQNSTFLLFSERVVLVEGKTEEMLLPDMYRVVRGTSLGRDKVCMVSATGSSSISPLMKVLRAVGFAPKAIVDLDFVFRHAASDGLIVQNDPDIAACMTWFAGNAAIVGFVLDASGLPMKGGALSAEEAFVAMAGNMYLAVQNLQAKMLPHEIWIWGKGAIEAHLGIQKNDPARISFLSTMTASNNLHHATDAAELQSALSWI
ncbi:MAG: AAA family ATPase [Gallionella sp.]|nr:AAA family ATPase [Gallionella sp.]